MPKKASVNRKEEGHVGNGKQTRVAFKGYVNYTPTANDKERLKNWLPADQTLLTHSLMSCYKVTDAESLGTAITNLLPQRCMIKIRIALLLGTIWELEPMTRTARLHVSCSCMFTYSTANGFRLWINRKRQTSGADEWQEVLPGFEEIMLPPSRDEW